MSKAGELSEAEAAEKLIRFLGLVRHANWRHAPSVWNEQIRQALSEGLVTVGFGGVLKLTESGRAALPTPDTGRGRAG